MAAWTNFAWSGNPNGFGDSPWPRFRSKKHLPGVLEQNIPFSTAITDAEFVAQHKCQLWDSILSYHPTTTASK